MCLEKPPEFLEKLSKIFLLDIPTFFAADTIDIKITGPLGYTHNISLFPDFNLKFETTLKLEFSTWNSGRSL